MSDMPKDGTPILAYCINRRSEGWMVIQWTGNYWQTIPGKYGVERIVTWAKLPIAPSVRAVVEVEQPAPQSPLERKP